MVDFGGPEDWDANAIHDPYPIIYNGKIHPLSSLAIKGVLWYQGESDMRNKLWDIELTVMARSWRDAFDVAGKGEDIPFYWIQIQRSGDYCSPLVRQEQFNALRLIPNSGMAVLLDLVIPPGAIPIFVSAGSILSSAALLLLAAAIALALLLASSVAEIGHFGLRRASRRQMTLGSIENEIESPALKVR